jgi:hypothetical protein
MNLKSIYIAIMCLPLTCGISKGMDQFSRLSLTDGKESNSQLTAYTGSSLGAYTGSSGTIMSNQTYTSEDFAKFKGNPFDGYTETGTKFVQVGISARDAFMLQAQIAYKGYDASALTRLQTNIQFLLNNPSIELGAVTAKQVVVTAEDAIYVNNLQQFIVDNFFASAWDDYTSVKSEAFTKMSKSENNSLGNFEHKSNSILYTMLYFVDKPESKDPFEITRKFANYNNFKFFISSCAGATEGEKINLDFSSNKFPYGIAGNVSPTSKDTILKNMSAFYSSYPFSFQFDAFKIDDATFRLNVTMSKEEDTKFVPQKISNIKVQIKK